MSNHVNLTNEMGEAVPAVMTGPDTARDALGTHWVIDPATRRILHRA